MVLIDLMSMHIIIKIPKPPIWIILHSYFHFSFPHLTKAIRSKTIPIEPLEYTRIIRLIGTISFSQNAHILGKNLR